MKEKVMFMLRSFRVTVGVLAVVSLGNVCFCGSFCDAWSGQPDFSIYGLCFSPYKDGQVPPDNVTAEQIRERLEIIAPYTQWIRSFSATSGLEHIPQEAKELGLKVAMGTWIRHEQVREEEINNLIEKAEAEYVDVAVVGNEELFQYENNNPEAIEPNVLVEAIESVRQRLDEANLQHIPVTTAEPWDVLFKRDGGSFKYQEVLDAVDVFFVNIYPFHELAHISRAIEKLDDTYSTVIEYANEVDPNRQVIISETGWPSDGQHAGAAKTSLVNAAQYFYEVQCWAARNNIKMFYFSSFDEKWKEPPEYEAHWGLWDSSGEIKEIVLPDHVFCEDFDTCMNPFCTYTFDSNSATDPNILGPDGDSNGQFMRVLYDGETSRLSSITFDRTAKGPFSRIIAEFDFRIFGDGYPGDGFSFLLMPTSKTGISGCHNYGRSIWVEQPALAETFAVGFEICDRWPCINQDSANRIYISWDGQWYPDNTYIDVSDNDIDFDSGKFHRARIELSCAEGDTGLVSVWITPDVYNLHPSSAVMVAQNVIIGEVDHPYKPYENRVEFAGRNGGPDTNDNLDIDNIYVSYRSVFCDYSLEGDVNGDCRINLYDLAILANHWLINCNTTPVNEACLPK
jgi:glucan 1,3-beta-glucosidase